MKAVSLQSLPVARTVRVVQDSFARVAGCGLLLAMMAAAPLQLHASDQFVQPSKEELAMTSLPGYPGAPAVVLFREEITKDDMHWVSHYERIKILTDEGKQFANVELRFSDLTDSTDDISEEKSVDEIVGRTIHADGTVIPFTGKPYLKTIVKGKDFKYQARVFTLPDVEVGSIIEYRYSVHYNDDLFEPPSWYIQGQLFVKSAHYVWYPTVRELGNEEGMISAIAWFPVLPKGADLQHHDLPGTAPGGGQPQIYELNVKDVPPQPQEEYMPPIASFSYRVLFYYTAYHSGQEFWKSAGKSWAKRADSFAGPNGDLRTATEAIVAGATTQDAKLRKIYAAVMELENTDYTRAREVQEDKAGGLGKVSNAADVLAHKRGSADQLTELFVGMARAAGMKAYLMVVPDRSQRLFTPGWLSFYQFDDILAIVNVDGQEMYFDPGSRYCPYGHLAWGATFAQGVRETDNGTDFGRTPGDAYKDNRSTRVANLTMDAQGGVSGSIELTFSGAPALNWRQRALRGDEESIHNALRKHLEAMLPKSLEITVAEIKNLEDYEQPLEVSYTVKGSLGEAAGKRMVLPVDLFAADDTATFPHDKRETAVYFHYPQFVQDALRIKFPSDIAVEAAPSSAKFDIPKSAVYSMNVASTPDSITVHRDFACNEVIVPTADYPALRTFYSQFESQDQGSVVLKAAAAGAPATAKAGGN